MMINRALAATALAIVCGSAAPASSAPTDDAKRVEAHLRRVCLKAHGHWLGITSAGFPCAGPWGKNPRTPAPIYGFGE